jgi:hypothetical protein
MMIDSSAGSAADSQDALLAGTRVPPQEEHRMRSAEMHQEVLATVPQNNGQTALEVALVYDGAGGTRLELRYLVWGDGLGWYRQQTLALDAVAARALLGSLGSVRHRLKPTTKHLGEGKVIPFLRRGAAPEARAQ